MADTRLCDCPNCNRPNVIGYKKEEKNTKIVKVSSAGYGTIMGAIIAGPIGAALGFALGKYGGEKLANEVEDDLIYFQFQCPKCDHRWEKLYKIK